jgi:TATA-box binding protein (TBP) (component of TFIID and TFIIIB)
MDTAKLRSDYNPETFIRIVISDDGDVSIAIYGKGEFKIAGFNGGGYLKSESKRKVIKAFREIVNALREETENEKTGN